MLLQFHKLFYSSYLHLNRIGVKFFSSYKSRFGSKTFHLAARRCNCYDAIQFFLTHVDKTVHTWIIKVQDFLNAAEAACSSSSAESFLCVDLVYISGKIHIQLAFLHWMHFSHEPSCPSAGCSIGLFVFHNSLKRCCDKLLCFHRSNC